MEKKPLVVVKWTGSQRDAIAYLKEHVEVRNGLKRQ